MALEIYKLEYISNLVIFVIIFSDPRKRGIKRNANRGVYEGEGLTDLYLYIALDQTAQMDWERGAKVAVL